MLDGEMTRRKPHSTYVQYEASITPARGRRRRQRPPERCLAADLAAAETNSHVEEKKTHSSAQSSEE
jgi:hypothetical protein